jgi:hypothetical protein
MPGLGLWGDDGGPVETKKRRIVVGVLVLVGMGAAIAATVLSPSFTGKGGPLELMRLAEPDAVAVIRSRDAAALWRTVESSNAWRTAPRDQILRALRETYDRLAPGLPPAVRALEPLAERLWAYDAALFLYAAPSGFEATVAARAPAAIDLDAWFAARDGGGGISLARADAHRGYTVRVLTDAKGRTLQLAAKDRTLLAASTRERLLSLVERAAERASPAPTKRPSLADSPAFRSASEALARDGRFFLYLDVPRLVSSPAGAAIRADAPFFDVLGPVALAFDTREGGITASIDAAVRSWPSWSETPRRLLGAPAVLRAPAVAPKNALAFAGLRLDPARLRERFAPSAALPNDFFAPVQRFIASALKKEVDATIENLTGEGVAGLSPATLLPSPFGMVGVRDEARAQATVKALAAFVPGDLADVIRALSTARERVVEGVRLTTRELPLVGGLGYGVHKGWLFGGGLAGAEAAARALTGQTWVMHPLAREVFSAQAHALGWIDASSFGGVVRALRGWFGFEELIRFVGRLAETLVDAGVAIRFDADRVVARAFLRLRDLQ